MNNTSTLATQLVNKLKASQWTVSAAESCTGGGISVAITEVPGSSVVFECGFVTYSNKAKQSQLDVNQQTLQIFGAVSAETVEEMALGALAASHANIAISVSGIAGPSGGSEDKPVGTVWFAVAVKSSDTNVQAKVKTYRYCFLGGRDEVRQSAVNKGLELLLSHL